MSVSTNIYDNQWQQYQWDISQYSDNELKMCSRLCLITILSHNPSVKQMDRYQVKKMSYKISISHISILVSEEYWKLISFMRWIKEISKRNCRRIFSFADLDFIKCGINYKRLHISHTHTARSISQFNTRNFICNGTP